MPTLLELIEKIMDDTSAATGVPRADMDNSLVFEAARQEDHIKAQDDQIAKLEAMNAALEKDAMDKITQLMKNQEILTADCHRLASLLEVEKTKVAYLGKLVELHRKKDIPPDNEEWGVSCAAAATLLSKVMSDDGATVESLKTAIKCAGTVLVGGIPEATTALEAK